MKPRVSKYEKKTFRILLQNIQGQKKIMAVVRNSNILIEFTSVVYFFYGIRRELLAIEVGNDIDQMSGVGWLVPL